MMKYQQTAPICRLVSWVVLKMYCRAKNADIYVFMNNEYHKSITRLGLLKDSVSKRVPKFIN